MICPHCGAEIEKGLEKCPLCEKEISTESEYEKFLKKGDEALAADETDKAIAAYSKALEYRDNSYEIYMKLGNAYNRKGDKQAVAMYFKAMTLNFYDDNIHNLVISMYARRGKLEELRKWYEANSAKYDADFIKRYTAIIDNMKYFSSNIEKPEEKKKDPGVMPEFFGSMKSYSMLNSTMLITGALILIALVGMAIFKVNMTFVFMFAGTFIVISIIAVIISKISRMKKKKQKTEGLEEIVKDFNKDRDQGPEIRD